MVKEIEYKFDWKMNQSLEELRKYFINTFGDENVSDTQRFSRLMTYYDTVDEKFYHTNKTLRVVSGFNEPKFRVDLKSGSGLEREEHQETFVSYPNLSDIERIGRHAPLEKKCETKKNYERIIINAMEYTFLVEASTVCSSDRVLFCELEIELEKGIEESFHIFCQNLKKKYSLQSLTKQKYQRIIDEIIK